MSIKFVFAKDRKPMKTSYRLTLFILSGFLLGGIAIGPAMVYFFLKLIGDPEQQSRVDPTKKYALMFGGLIGGVAGIFSGQVSFFSRRHHCLMTASKKMTILFGSIPRLA